MIKSDISERLNQYYAIQQACVKAQIHMQKKEILATKYKPQAPYASVTEVWAALHSKKEIKKWN